MGTLLWQPPRALRNVLTYEFPFLFPAGDSRTTFDSPYITTFIDWSGRQNCFPLSVRRAPVSFWSHCFSLFAPNLPISFFFHNRPPFSTVFTKRKEVNQCDVGFEYSQRNARSRWLPSSDLPPRGSSSVLSVQSFYHLDWHEEKRFDGYSYANQRWK